MQVTRNVVFMVRELNVPPRDEIFIFAFRDAAVRFCSRNLVKKEKWQDFYEIIPKTVRVR